MERQADLFSHIANRLEASKGNIFLSINFPFYKICFAPYNTRPLLLNELTKHSLFLWGLPTG